MPDLEREKIDKILNDGRNHELIVEQASLLDQKEGLVRLFSFLWEKPDFEQLSPFTLDLSSKTGVLDQRTNPLYLFYLGGIGRKNKYLSLTIPTEIIESNNGKIWVFPRSLQRGLNPYYWLEYYNPDDQSDDIVPFSSCRLNPEKQNNKTNFRSWHGVGEELLANYILGENELTFEDLSPVDICPKSTTSLANYHLGGKMNLTLSVYENSLIQEGDHIRLMPKRDDQKIYEWLEVARIIDGLPNHLLPLVSSYRLLHERPFLTTFGWYGYERQLLIDYLLSRSGIKFDNLRPIRAVMTPKLEYLNIVHNKDLSLEIYIPEGSMVSGDEAFISPEQDNQMLYQWLNVHKTDPENQESVGESITAVRMVDGKFQQKDWQGPNLQLLRDYAKEKVTFSNLQPVPFVVGKGKDLIHLWKEKSRRVYLVMSKDFHLKDGDNLLLVPEQVVDDGTTFILEREGTRLARYQLDLMRVGFKLINNFIANVPNIEGVSVSPEEAERALDKFFEEVEE